jgi:uncharacterized repeat protein (TIGR01451 family)
VLPVLTSWTPVGPAPVTNGQVPGGGAVSGRITGVAADPIDPNTIFIAAAGGGVWKTTNGGTSWNPLTDHVTDGSGNPVVEFMGAVTETRGPTNNEVVYAGTGEANNSGDSGYGEGILVSPDGGTTWTLENAGGAFTGLTVSRIAIDPGNSSTVYAATAENGVNGTFGVNTGIWRSINGGVTWTNMTAAVGLSTSDDWSDVVIDPRTSGATAVLFAAIGTSIGSNNNGVFESTNGGTSWSPVTGLPSGSNDGRISLAIAHPAAATNATLYASISDTSGNLLNLEKSTDGGATWKDLTSNLGGDDYLTPQGDYDNVVAINPTNTNIAFAAGVEQNQGPTFNGGGIVETQDGGTTWTNGTSHPDINTGTNGKNGPRTDYHALAFDASGRLLVGNDGGIWRLDSNSLSPKNILWTDLNGNLDTIQFEGIAVDPNNPAIAYGGSQDNGTEKTTGTLSWNLIVDGDGGITRLDPLNDKVVYQENSSPNGANDISLQVSTNAGGSFTDISGGLVTNFGPNFYAPYVLDSSGNVYYGTDFLNLSADQGNTWSQIGTPGTNNFNPNSDAIDAVAVSPTTNNVVYVSAQNFNTGAGEVFVTKNAQAANPNNVSWTEIDLPGGWVAGGLNSIAVDPSDATGGTAYAVVNSFTGGGNHVFKTTNFGGLWTDVSHTLLDTPVNAVAVSPDGKTVYIGTDVGVYFTTDGGTKWAVFQSGLPNVQVVELDLIPSQNLLAVGTHGRGAFEVTTLPVADLQVSASGPATVTAGNNATYTVTLTNKGPSDAQAVSLTDTLPSGTTLVSFGAVSGHNPDGFTYTPSNGTITGTPTNGVVAAGNQDEFTLVVQVPSNATSGSTLGDTANVTTTSLDDNDAINDETFTVNSTVTAVADLQVSASGPATVTAGTTITYTVTLTNAGPSDAQSVSLTDTVPSGTTLVSFSAVSGQNPDGFTYTPSNGTVTGTPPGNGVVAAGNLDEFTVVVQVASNAGQGSTIGSDTATVTTTTTDDNEAVNDETATVPGATVTTVADLQVSGSGPATATVGTNVTFTITLTNKGPSDAQAVSLTDTVPSGTTFVSAGAVNGQNPDGFSYSPPGGTVTGTPTGGVVAAGHQDEFTLVVHVLGGSVIPPTISSTATVTTTTTDDNNTLPDDETTTVSSTVKNGADLRVTESGPATVTAGTTITYTVTLTNASPGVAAQSVSLTDTMPGGTTFVSASPVNGHNPDQFSYTPSNGTVTGTPAGAVAAGSQDEFTVVVVVPSNAANTSRISNSAAVTTASGDQDDSGSDEATTSPSTVTTVADLQVSASGPATVTAGTTITYTVTLTNKGPSDAQAVSLTDTVPSGTTFVSATAVNGQNPDGFTYTPSNGTVTGTPTGGVVAAGHQDEFTLVVQVPSGTANNFGLSSTATVTSNTTDDNEAVNDETTTVTGTVTTAADLVVAQGVAAPPQEGGTLTLTLLLTNAGPSDAQGVGLADAAPAGTTLLAERQTGGPDPFNNTSSGGTASFTAGTVTAGSTDTFQLVLRVGEDGTVTNTVSATSSTPSPRPADATSVLPISVPEAPTVVTAKNVTGFENVSASLAVAAFTHGNGAEAAGGFSVQIDWGDGSPLDTGTVVASGGGYLVEGIHSFAELGQYQVQVAVFDDGVLVGRAVSTATVVVPLPPGVPRTPLTGYVADVFNDLFGLQADAGTILSLSARNLFDIRVRRNLLQSLLKSPDLQQALRVRAAEVLLRGILGRDPTTFELMDALAFLARDHARNPLRDLTRHLLQEMGRSVSLAQAEATMIGICYQAFLGRLARGQDINADFAAVQPNAARSDEQELGMIVVSDVYFGKTLTD